ncbi:branched-chain amino acid ABC transporter permease [Pseudoalteromonas rubra]|uniref:Branched-chain amino acid ABC transporter permease n=1 Tax=Pseudoalteromonas rubra TaxID=43658 RepID=A0A4Q7EN77_9GAMM|nr:AzlC family ABC transporter permease [Pseudoalteromonas rubra]RZM84922.1 branched-chain amino acid ABC transporter permease [Pseudoalteromonas rubra]
MSTEQAKPVRSIKLAAFFDILPLSIAVIPWGILCGSLAIQVGLSPLQSQLMSLLVFAGAAQLSALTLTGASAGIATILGSTAVISSRHLLYSATFRSHAMGLPLHHKMLMAFLLTDEMFAVTENKRKELGYFPLDYALISGATFYAIWNLSTLAGIVAGTSIPNLESLGLEFAIAATFIAMVVPNIQSSPVLVAVLVSACCAVLFHKLEVPNDLLLSALVGMVVGYCLDKESD